MVELTFDKLYLAKDGKDSKQDIYVVKCPLVQHQLDGIRFLYKALKKKQHGVVLNDPSGYGKRVQTALFLSAVLPILDKPVLILCREGKEQQWMSHFQEWTEVSNDVAIELVNPFAKKKVLISACYTAATFARRDWSVLVVDDDLISRDIKSMLKANFRIWITSSAIKNDLEKYSTFYSWVYPKNKFDGNKFKANSNDLNDILTKTAMLDAFLEDTVLRRECGGTPFPKAQDSISNNTETRITKKNKDSTGMKIKRSKRKSLDKNNARTTEVTPNKVAKNKITTENTEIFEVGDVNNLEPKGSRNIENNAIDFEISGNNAEENYASMKRRDKGKKSTVLWDSEGPEDEVRVNKCNSQLDESEEQTTVLRWDSDSEDSHKKITTESNEETKSGKTKPRNSKPMNTYHNEIKLLELNTAKNDIANSSSSLIVNSQKQYETLHENEIDNEVIDKIVITNQFSQDIFSTDFIAKQNEITVEVNDIKNTNISTSLNNYKVKSENENTKTMKQNELNVKTGQKMEQSANLSIFELKMKELEELTLKKYKGSFLDSIL